MRTLVAAVTLFFGVLGYVQAVQLEFDFIGGFGPAQQVVPTGFDPSLGIPPPATPDANGNPVNNIAVVTDNLTGVHTAVFGSFNYTVSVDAEEGQPDIVTNDATAEISFAQFPDTVFVVDGVSFSFTPNWFAPRFGSGDPTQFIVNANLDTLFYTFSGIELHNPGPDIPGNLSNTVIYGADNLFLTSLSMVPEGFNEDGRVFPGHDPRPSFEFLSANNGRYSINLFVQDNAFVGRLTDTRRVGAAAVPVPSTALLLVVGALFMRRLKQP